MISLPTYADSVSKRITREQRQSFDYDVLENIISAYANENVRNSLVETQEAALGRQSRCRQLGQVSWLFRTIAERQLFGHLHFPTVDSVIKLFTSMQLTNSPSCLEKIRMYTRCVSFGFTFDNCNLSSELKAALMTIQLVLEACGERLQGFRQLGSYMSSLPAPLWQTLRTRCTNLEYLDGFGFSLNAESQSGEAFIQHMFGFRKLRRLTTSVVWLPPTFIPEVRRPMLLTEEEKRQCGLLGCECKQRFANLVSLRTPLVQWDNLLVEALLIADLPNLRNLQLGMWESETVFRFLERHGSKLVSVDLLLCRWSTWPSMGESHRQSTLVRLPQRFQIEHILERCPSLRTITLHQNEALHALIRRAPMSRVQSHLDTLRLGSNDDGSYAAMLEYQPPNEVSFAFMNLEELERTQEQLSTTNWKSLFPHLREIVVYWSPPSSSSSSEAVDGADEEKQASSNRTVKESYGKVLSSAEVVPSIQAWQDTLGKQGITLSIQGPPLETE